MHYPKVLERVDFPEQIFHRSFSLGVPVNCAKRAQSLIDGSEKRICLLESACH